MQRNRTAPRRAFTLVELLAVVAIIALLIGILVPTIGAARRAARNTQTKGSLQTLQTGLEAFRGEQKIGGTFPPSYSDGDEDSGMGVGRVTSPFTNQPISISGAGLLVWALSGADLLGTPGFPKLGQASWARASGSNSGNQAARDSNAYALYPPGHARAGEPVHTRFMYIDPSGIPLTPPGETNGTFRVPAELRAGVTAVRQYPMYLDSFGQPILYFRASAGGRNMAARDRQADARAIFYLEDNWALLNPGNRPSGSSPGEYTLMLDDPDGGRHRLPWVNLPTGANAAQDDLTEPSFARYIRDRNVKARFQPQRAEGYLLITAGPDGVFGSKDDITNFEPDAR
ncbi:MAG: type II secretion system protein [Phycisphaerales bacterium]|nr:type II secretion system protein [Phycisphaerales bacterium]